jgi:hypothetical protein
MKETVLSESGIGLVMVLEGVGVRKRERDGGGSDRVVAGLNNRLDY